MNHSKRKKILLPIKNYEQGKLALRVLIGEPFVRAAELHLLHVIEDKLARPNYVHALEVINAVDDQSDAIDHAQLFLKRLCAEFEEHYPEMTMTHNSIVTNSVSQAILDEATNESVDSIMVIASPQRPFRWFFQDVSGTILNQAKMPVHIIKPPEENSA